MSRSDIPEERFFDAKDVAPDAIVAVQKFDAALLAAALKGGADPNELDERGWSAAMWAARGFPREPEQPWMAGALAIRAQCLGILAQHGANLSAKNNMSWTPAHWPARDGNEPALRILARQGALDFPTHAYIGAPARLAILEGRFACISTLAKFGVFEKMDNGEIAKLATSCSADSCGGPGLAHWISVLPACKASRLLHTLSRDEKFAATASAPCLEVIRTLAERHASS